MEKNDGYILINWRIFGLPIFKNSTVFMFYLYLLLNADKNGRVVFSYEEYRKEHMIPEAGIAVMLSPLVKHELLTIDDNHVITLKNYESFCKLGE